MNEKDKWINGTKADTQADAQASGQSDPNWEKKLISDLAMASLKEQRKSRRWGIFFRLLGFAYLTVVLVSAFRDDIFDTEISSGGHTALVDVYGIIASDQSANAQDIVSGLQDAFEDADTRAVLLRVNSPGGSPVQSGVIYDEILRLREAYPETPLYAVIEDTCASGGYYIASAAEKIFADKASLVGSIGVRMDGFGFVEAMDKMGIERRLLTAGDNKALLDPFSPSNDNQVAHINSMLENIHSQFIDAVKEGRGDRLSDSTEIFSGLVWSGEQALELGLVDELANQRTIARDIVKAETMVNFTPQEDLLTRLAGRVGAGASAALAGILLQGGSIR